MKKRSFQKRSRKRIPLKTIIFGGLFFCLSIALGYFLIFSPIFWIQEIEVEEIKNVPVSEIEEIARNNLEGKLWQLIPRKSFILLPVDNIKQDILDSFPGIRAVTVEKRKPNFLNLDQISSGASLYIKAEERESIGIWCQLKEEEMDEATISTTTDQIISFEDRINKCFYIDQEGIIFRESLLVSGNLVVNIYSQIKDSVDLRKKITSKEVIDFILSANKKLPQIETIDGNRLDILGFEIISIESLEVVTSFGWQIYFNPSFPLDSQLNALEMVLLQDIKENYSVLEYIDLSIEGRVYYK